MADVVGVHMVQGTLSSLTSLVKWSRGRTALLVTKQSAKLLMHYENSIRVRLSNNDDLISFPYSSLLVTIQQISCPFNLHSFLCNQAEGVVALFSTVAFWKCILSI